MRGLRIAVAALVLSGAATAAVEPQPEQVAESKEAVASAAPSELANYLIAKQGKAEVWAIDVDAHLEAMPAADRAGFIDSPKRIQQMLSHILLRRNLAIEARELGLDKGPVVQRELEQAIEVVLMRHRLSHIRDNSKVPDLQALAKEKFLANQAAFVSKETVSVAHILLDTKERTEEQAIAQLQAWKADVASGKAKIEELAKAHSDDPGVPNNSGVYANTDVASFVPEFADAVRKLEKPGDLSDVVKTEFGFHLIQLRDRTPGRPLQWEEVKEQLVAYERENYIKKIQADHLEELKNLPIEASEASVFPLRERYGKLQHAPAAAPQPPAAAAPEGQDADSAK